MAIDKAKDILMGAATSTAVSTFCGAVFDAMHKKAPSMLSPKALANALDIFGV